MGNHDRCFVDLFDDSLSSRVVLLAINELLLVGELLLVVEDLVSSSEGLSLHVVLSLEKLSGMH